MFLGGFAKCGTTDLYEKLIWHPDLVSPRMGKENHYWTKTSPRSRLGERRLGDLSRYSLGEIKRVEERVEMVDERGEDVDRRGDQVRRG